MKTFVVSLFCLAALGAAVSAEDARIRTGHHLVSSVLLECSDMSCVKTKVLSYLDNLLGLDEDARSVQNLDAAIFKRMARVLKTHEFHFRLPEMIFGGSEVVYSPKTGLDIASTESESRGVLKKKLLLPVLLLLKLKLKALMPIFVALIGIKALKALVLSKLAITLVLGFIIVQLCKKAGMAMPMSMMPMEPPMPTYGAPPTSSPSSYEPGWEPSSQGGPYSRVWTGSSSLGGSSDSSQSIAYSAYYPSPSSSTTRP